ncbi:MAG: HlyD family efflux transporter periplasmic adaptor subunit [Cyclobacteriaceae bacterium]|nr:HlyD family efflux transporter periplasmic adaptor subunit [Cyclobacteriaceae bacterium]
MLNISNSKDQIQVDTSKYESFRKLKDNNTGRLFAKVVLGLLLLILLVMFFPWTQNIRAKGYVTSLRPDQRPQEIQTVIAGRIESWHVQEGDFVKKGDTILFISEIKDDYFDPNLLDRTNQQIEAKDLTRKSYDEKVRAMENQIVAITQMQKLKAEQAYNKLSIAQLKVTTDSIEYEASKTNYTISELQLERMKQLYNEGLKSLTELESRTLKQQESQAKLIGYESKLLSSRNELINARIELSAIDSEYRDKLAKANAEKFSALSSVYGADAELTKLQNQYSNYSVRSGLYYITAPQDGYVTQAIKTGLGETIKEGASVVSIMPAKYDLAVEMYIKPMDLPLLKIGQGVRFMFDGWPAIVFSGWPNVSYGTFGGKVVAIDNFTSKDGNYRILVGPDEKDTPWPTAIRPGSGANGFALLNDVPIWYEIWREINGFPPDYYSTASQQALEALDK